MARPSASSSRRLQIWVYAIGSLIMCRVTVGHLGWPLAPAVVGALAVLPDAWIYVLAAAIGTASSGAHQAVVFALLTLAIGALAMVLQKNGRERSEWMPAVYAGLLTLPVAWLLPGPGWRLLWPPLVFLLAVLLAQAFKTVRVGAAGDDRRIWLAVLAVGCVCGLHGIDTAGLPLTTALAELAALVAVRVEGRAIVFVVALAGALLLEGAASPALVGALALGTALAGWVRSRNGFWIWTMFASGVLIALVPGASTAVLQTQIAALLLLGALTMALPAGVYRRFAQWLRPLAPEIDEEQLPKLQRARRMLLRLGDDLLEGGAEIDPEDGFTAQLSQVREHVCVGCPYESICWDAEFYRTYTGLRELQLRADAGVAPTAADLPAQLRQRCPRPAELTTSIALVGEAQRVQAALRSQLVDERRLGRQVVEGLSQILAWVENPPVTQPPPELSYLAGLARVPGLDGAVCGDSYAVSDLGDQRLLIGVSDGMGMGAAAARVSERALHAVNALLACGVDVRSALSITGAIYRGDVFTTMDLVVVDLCTGRATSWKLGAPESFLLRDRRLQVLRGSAPPLGMGADAQPTEQRFSVAEGDLLVLASDGVVEGPGGERGRWMEPLITELGAADPQVLAEALVEVAMRARRERAKDDLTVLVTRFFQLAQKPEIRAWVRRSSTEMGIVGDEAGQTGSGRGRRARG